MIVIHNEMPYRMVINDVIKMQASKIVFAKYIKGKHTNT